MSSELPRQETLDEEVQRIGNAAEKFMRERDEDRAEVARLRALMEQARDLVARAYSEDEDDDSPGNMAFAVLNAALEDQRHA